MSNRLTKLQAVTPIPQVVAGTVALANKFVIGSRNPNTAAASGFLSADDKIQERYIADLLVLVTSAGTHANITATLEGSMDGVGWFGLQYLLGAVPPGFTISAAGLVVPVAAAIAGYTLRFGARFPYYRIGLAGDAAAGGAGEVGLTLSRNE